MRPNPKKRATLDQVLRHPFFDFRDESTVTQPLPRMKGVVEDMMVQDEEAKLLRLFEMEGNEEDAKDVVMTMDAFEGL